MNLILTTRRLSWVLLVTIIFWFGCSKKDTDIVPSAATLQGPWLMSGYTIDPASDIVGNGTKTNDILDYYRQSTTGQQIIDCFRANNITFVSDGTVTSTTTVACSPIASSPIPNNSIWVLTGTKITITDGADAQEYDVSIIGNTLKLSQTYTDDFDNDGKTELRTISFVLTKV